MIAADAVRCGVSNAEAGIEAAFVHATSRIAIEGTEVVPFPLFRVLDGKTSSDYCQRVEPSPSGGRKMAWALLNAAMAPPGAPTDTFFTTPETAQQPMHMEQRG